MKSWDENFQQDMAALRLKAKRRNIAFRVCVWVFWFVLGYFWFEEFMK